MSQTVKIVVNGREKQVEKDEISFSDIVVLAFGEPPTGENTIYTVAYKRGQGSKPEGSLVHGETVRVKDGMIFNVTRTDKS